MCSKWLLFPWAFFAGSLLSFYGEDTSTTQLPEVKKSEIRIGNLGYFDIGEPWTTPLRPVPPPMGPEDNPAFVYLYSWRNKSKSYTVTLYPEVHVGDVPFDGQRPTAVIIHGYNTNAAFDWILHLKDAYLRRVEGNVLLLDWSRGSSYQILQASSNTRVIAKLSVRLLEYFMVKRGLHRDMIHLIGHSLGAHVASYIAKEISGIPRLTALDPAQPAFEGYPKEVRLDKSDAVFVEVIHTSAKPFIPHFGLGMVKPHGHVDFYFNDGGDQPGCTLPDEIPKIRSISDFVKYPFYYDINVLACSHGRSHEYLTEAYNKTTDCIFWGRRATASVNNTAFVAEEQKPDLYSNFSVHSTPCNKDTCIPFGLETIKSPLRGVFVVRTNSHPPFCMFESVIVPKQPEYIPESVASYFNASHEFSFNLVCERATLKISSQLE